MTLTEKWKAGDLPFGAYYVNRLEEHRVWLYNDRSKTPESQHEIYEIMAPVPSYEEWQTVFNYATKYEVEYVKCVNDYEELKNKNQQLKDVISKMCMELVDADDDMSNGLAEYFNQDLLLEIHEVLK